VRELQNCIERAVILADGDTILPRHLNLSFIDESAHEAPDPWANLDLSGSLSDVTRRATAEAERRKIQDALKEAAGNKGHASELLQVSYKTLLAKLKEHKIE
jgi:two-component system response regulator AtoC